MRKAIILALLISLVIPFITTEEPVGAQLATLNLPSVAQGALTASDKIAPQVQTALDSGQDGEMISVIVTLTDQADLSRIPGASRAARLTGVIRALQALAETSQKQIQALLTARAAQGLVSRVEPFWVFNGLAVTATPEVIQELAARADVAKITPDEISIVPAQGGSNPAEPNLSVIKAPALWDLGWYGQAIVVANMDTGVDVTHPDLSTRWRGGSNSWFDPYGEHPSTPTDLDGHGTWTMGTMVGGDAGGTFVGVAPQAQWIAVKIFDDRGSSTASAVHQGFQWLLDPDGNPNTADAPHVVDNSWTFAYPGCDLEFQLDIASLRAAGILSVFPAGNYGPNSGTSVSPANNPDAFALGATDDNDLIYAYSSRGPSSCGEATTIYPELVAPGVGIHTTDLYGFYNDATGTSLAAPHVAGGLALLLSAYPDLTATQQENALKNSALDLGAGGPDNVFGYGRLDVLAAYQWINNNPTPTPTPTPNNSVNLALNQPVTVSSFQDGSHDGSMAVDGDLGTFWQSKKAVGKKTSSSEWIAVDLGNNVAISQVVLEWTDNYATSYAIRVSSDNNNWATVFSTTSGNGGNDTISFGSTSARYVRMETTAWNDSSLRTWLKEFEIYSDGSMPTPTPTPAGPTPTNTPTPAPTATATPGATVTVHVGDLDGSSSPGNRNRWEASVIVTVHDASENPLSGANVSGTWSNGISGSDSCVTDSAGTCSITKSNIKSNVSSVAFSIDAVSHASMQYEPLANHDPDGDSNGTSISIPAP